MTDAEIDFTDLAKVRGLAPEGADSVVFMGSDWVEQADARTLMGSLSVEELIRRCGPEPTVSIELLDSDNANLVGRSRGELIISPLVVSHLLTQVALRPELQSVFDELFTVGGAQITFRPVAFHAESARFSLEDLERAAAAVGETAVGGRTRATGRVELDPSKSAVRDEPADHDLVALVAIGDSADGKRVSPAGGWPGAPG